MSGRGREGENMGLFNKCGTSEYLAEKLAIIMSHTFGVKF